MTNDLQAHMLGRDLSLWDTNGTAVTEGSLQGFLWDYSNSMVRQIYPHKRVTLKPRWWRQNPSDTKQAPLFCDQRAC